MPSRERAVIFNPRARSEQAGKFLSEIPRLSPDAKLYPTSAPGDATRIARELASRENPPSCLIAAGGDGTINEVARGLHDVNLTRVESGRGQIPLGLLPLGTMNVFSLEMKVPRDIRRAWEIIEHGLTRNVDLWRVGNHTMLQLAGVGFDASVIRNTPWQDKKQLGPLSYVISALGMLGEEHPPVTLHAEGRDPIGGRVVLLGNGRFYGGPFPVFPNAAPDDGLLDVLILPRATPGSLLQFLTGVARGSIEDLEDVISFQTSSLRIESAAEIPCEVDGELAGSTPLIVERDPLPMMVLC